MTNRRPGPIPNRWLHCPRKSDTIIAERFLAFKTPLSNAYKDDIPLECLFPPEMIFGYCKALKLKLGLWIDLTNTKRFYDREVIESHDVKYVKLQCRGHGETPSPEQTQSFIELVAEFINERPLDIIAVHCTHGFNRTGFLIASYLVERLDCSVEAALSMFANARPPGIYKQDYINELYRRYEDENDATPAPELPEWCLEYDDSNVASSSGTRKKKYDDMFTATTSQEAQWMPFSNNSTSNGNISDEADEESGHSDLATNGANARKPKRRRREMVIKNATFMPGVPGVVLVIDQPRLSELQIMVQRMCGWDKSGFPGAQPVSMDKKNIKFLSVNPYRVSWKADGTRYMMLIKARDEIYFFDRNFSCFQVENLSFVKSSNLNEHLENTLLDGEMVIDMLGKQSVPRYLIYDIVSFLNKNIGKQPFCPDRLSCIRNEIYVPRQKAKDLKIINRSKEPFSIHYKDFWDIRQSASLLGEKFAKSLLHKPDGLIFQPSKTPYMAGACPDVLKWKPQNMNSVDFRLKISTESGVGILNTKIGLLYVGGHDMPFGKIKYTKVLKDFDNKIIECTVNKYGQWEFLRDRPDKTLPNSYNTAQSVVESIVNPVTTELLLGYIDRFGYTDGKDRMPPPSSHAQQSTLPHQHHYQQNQQQQHQKQQQQHQQQPQHYQQHQQQQEQQQQYQNHRPPPN